MCIELLHVTLLWPLGFTWWPSDLQEATQAAQAAAAREQSLTGQAQDLSEQVKLLSDATAGLQADAVRRSEQEAGLRASLTEQQLRASGAEQEVARLAELSIAEGKQHKVTLCCADLLQLESMLCELKRSAAGRAVTYAPALHVLTPLCYNRRYCC